MTKKKSKKYPEKLFVYHDGSHLFCYEYAKECVDFHGEQIVAIYSLEGMGAIRVEVIFDD